MKIHNRLNHTIVSRIAVTFAFILSFFSIGASSQAKTETVASKPSIDAKLTVFTSNGDLRIYPTGSGGQEYYTDGLPIQQGDKIKLGVFVATGGFELKHIKVRLDNQLIADVIHAPWGATIDTGNLPLGNHMIEIWAQSESPAPYSSDTAIVNFFTAPTVPTIAVETHPETVIPNPVPQPTAIVAPPPASTRPPFPAVLSGLRSSERPVIAFSISPADAQAQYAGGQAVDLSSPVSVTVIAPKGSTANKFVYILVRDGAAVFGGTTTSAVNVTKVVLQAKNGASVGLNPGKLTMQAWGLDDQGSYGPMASMDITVPEPQEKL